MLAVDRPNAVARNSHDSEPTRWIEWPTIRNLPKQKTRLLKWESLYPSPPSLSLNLWNTRLAYNVTSRGKSRVEPPSIGEGGSPPKHDGSILLPSLFWRRPTAAASRHWKTNAATIPPHESTKKANLIKYTSKAIYHDNIKTHNTNYVFLCLQSHLFTHVVSYLLNTFIIKRSSVDWALHKQHWNWLITQKMDHLILIIYFQMKLFVR